MEQINDAGRHEQRLVVGRTSSATIVEGLFRNFILATSTVSAIIRTGGGFEEMKPATPRVAAPGAPRGVVPRKDDTGAAVAPLVP